MTDLASRFLGLARRAWVTVRVAIQALLPCRFAVVVLCVVTVALTLADQGLESLRVMAEFGDASQVGAHEPYLVRLLLFFPAAVTLASSPWYFSRQALLLEPPRKPVSREEAAIFTWAPRVFGALGFACPGLALWLAAGPHRVHEGTDQILSPRLLLRILGVAFFLLGLLFCGLLAFRRSLLDLDGLTIPERSRR